MIKGVNHTIIEVANPCNQYFERALLFVRPQSEQIKHQQLQKAADLFVETIGTPPTKTSYTVHQQKKNRKIKRRIFYFCWWIVGMICGFVLHYLVNL